MYRCNRVPETIGGHPVKDRCIKELVGEANNPLPLVDLNGCKLTCGQFGTIWPQPTGKVNLSESVVSLVPTSVTFNLVHGLEDAAAASTGPAALNGMLRELEKIFKMYMYATHPAYDPDSNEDPYAGKRSSRSVDVRFEIRRGDELSPKMDQDESYTLRVTSSPNDNRHDNMVALIKAETYFGARHAVETLSQLMAYDYLTGAMQMVANAYVEDKPSYTHRGILLDTSRNFFSMKILKRVVDGLSYNKMNVFHWHITDTHSFPLKLKSIPQLAEYGAYSEFKTYSAADVAELVEYGRIRGVKILPEFDAPAHVGNGWQFAEQLHPEWGRLAVCVNKEEWQDYCVEPPCGQFNVLNDKVYELLGVMFEEWMRMFDSDVFHMGGDEVNFNCWNTSSEFRTYMVDNGLEGSKEDYLDLWRAFQQRAYEKMAEAKGERIPAIIWTNSMTEEGVEKFLNVKEYIIQLWTKLGDADVSDIINKGYRTIYSPWDRFYLDCGYSSWVGTGNNWCSPYKGWQLIYETSPRKSYLELEDSKPEFAANILGGEACMWAEQVEGVAVEGKLWPRGAALGERLWADPDNGWKEAEQRFLHQRERMVARGIAADAHQPEWCYQNEDLCYSRV